MARACAGFDVGNSASCVSLAHGGRVELVMNGDGKRETVSVLSYSAKRIVGDTSLSARANTVNQLKRLIGKQYADPLLQKDIRDGHLMF